jgi:hypothetical protein
MPGVPIRMQILLFCAGRVMGVDWLLAALAATCAVFSARARDGCRAFTAEENLRGMPDWVRPVLAAATPR